MKIKTSELIGPTLDWAVAASLWPEHIHKYPAWWFSQHPDGCYLWEALDGGDSSVASFSPQTLWSQGGPIIEREEIGVRRYWNDAGQWIAESRTGFGIGPTPLIAAMRCFVTATLGDEVEVPEELS